MVLPDTPLTCPQSKPRHSRFRDFCCSVVSFQHKLLCYLAVSTPKSIQCQGRENVSSAVSLGVGRCPTGHGISLWNSGSVRGHPWDEVSPCCRAGRAAGHTLLLGHGTLSRLLGVHPPERGPWPSPTPGSEARPSRPPPLGRPGVS